MNANISAVETLKDYIRGERDIVDVKFCVHNSNGQQGVSASVEQAAKQVLAILEADRRGDLMEYSDDC